MRYDKRTVKIFNLLGDVGFPAWAYFDVDPIYNVEIQADTQSKVKELRGCFKGAVWEKFFNKNCGWWEYKTTYEGESIKIYAVTEAPKSCTPIYDEVEVEEKIPIEYETKTVKKKTLVGHKCGGKVTMFNERDNDGN